MIDLTPLRNALARLDVALRALDAAPQDEFIRDACIKRFEYCYELSHKMLRRHLQATEPEGVDQLTFPEMVRLGFARGLLVHSWDVWNDFRKARNETSHTYDEAKVKTMLDRLPDFAAEAGHLCDELARRNNA